MFDKGLSISKNFDELMELARNSPQTFESVRKHMVDQMIESMPEGRKLNMRRYQWRIDQETSRHDNSMGCCIKLSSMMSARMLELGRQLDLLHGASAEQFSETVADRKNAVVRLDKIADF